MDTYLRGAVLSLCLYVFSPGAASADVTDLLAVQTRFSDPTDGNAVFLVWTENQSNAPDGVSVLLDGMLFRSVPETPGASFPRANTALVTGLTAGHRSFAVAGGGMEAHADQVVLDAQPFLDVRNLSLRESDRDPATGNCLILASWEAPEPSPGLLFIQLDGVIKDTVPPTLTPLFFLVAPGHHCVTVIGFKESEDEGKYRGAFIEACIDARCLPIFHRGDADNNGELQLTDAIRILGFLFLGGAPPTCFDAADADGNNQLQLTDAIRILGFLFLGGAPPIAPGPPPSTCGTDNDTTQLGCAFYDKC